VLFVFLLERHHCRGQFFFHPSHAAINMCGGCFGIANATALLPFFMPRHYSLCCGIVLRLGDGILLCRSL
jgi:hypothetical protein